MHSPPRDVLHRSPAFTLMSGARPASPPPNRNTIAERELAVVMRRLELSAEACRTEQIDCPIGPGNVLVLELAAGDVVEIVTGFGEKGVSAEQVAARACGQASAWLSAGVPVGEHLADQLLVPCAVAGRGRFRTVEPSGHTRTNADVIKRFLPVDVTIEDEGQGAWLIDVGRAAADSRS